jgi:hypothetical protein
MTRPLLDRQARLLEYLTSGGAIFRDRFGAALDAGLAGIDRGLLDLEARFSHEKRMEKIVAVFPATFALLGDDTDAVVRDFVDACPPRDISRIENARQFHEFLLTRWAQIPPRQPCLRDVAACELACAQARVLADTEPRLETMDIPRPAMRRHPGVVLLRTAHDIRAVLESGDATAAADRETRLAIVLLHGEPQIFELSPEVFDVLAALDRWTAAGELAGAGDLIDGLAQAGLLEVRR